MKELFENLEPCLKKIEFNVPNAEVTLFYPTWFRNYFTYFLSSCDSEKEEYKGYTYEIFKLTNHSIKQFMIDIDVVFNNCKDKLKKELLIKKQIEKMNFTELSDITNDRKIEIDYDIIDLINNTNKFEYYDESIEIYNELLSISETKLGNNVDKYTEETEVISNVTIPSVNTNIINKNEPNTKRQSNYDDVIMVNDIQIKHKKVNDYNNTNMYDIDDSNDAGGSSDHIYGPDDEVPC